MPGMDGFELCRRVKRIADLPIIVLSSVDASEAKVRALEEYAEDYITKPFDPDELVARINRVMRRASSGPGTLRLDDGELELDLAARKAVTPAGTQQLTPTEVRLLQVLVANIDRPVSTEMLLDRVWSDADGADPSYVWVSMRRLRRKLELDPDNPRYLLTERGVGYRLVSTG
jgi:two-component system KDP operon response regulator KdpE